MVAYFRGGLSMMFIIALSVPWCRLLGALGAIRIQLHAEHLTCVASVPALLLRAARFTTGYVCLVGQEPAPSKCVLRTCAQQGRFGRPCALGFCLILGKMDY